MRNRPPDALPVKEHVRRFATVFTESGRPCHFELVTESESATSGNGLVAEVCAGEHTVVRELLCNRAEESERLGGRPEVTHMPGQHHEKRLRLLRSESNRHTFFLRPAYLIAELRVEASEQRVCFTWKVEDDRDLAVRCGEVDREGHPTAQFEQLDIVATCNLDAFLYERPDSGSRAKRTTVVEKRHRNQIVPEHHALHSNKRKHTNQRSALASRQVDAFVAENILDYPPPPKLMKMGVADLVRRKGVPLQTKPRKSLNRNRQATPWFICERSRSHK